MSISIPGVESRYYVKFSSSRLRCSYEPLHRILIVRDVCVVHFYKFHSHRYDVSAFFYGSLDIYSMNCFRSKSDMEDWVQSVIDSELGVSRDPP